MTQYRQTAIKLYLRARGRILTAIRQFFNANGYLETETPNRIPAPAPEAHIEAIPSGGWYLHTSPELCMKRLLAAGFDRIYQISKCYRHHERGSLHLPEFTLLEWYCSGIDYHSMMNQCEELIRYVVQDIQTPDAISFRGQTIHLDRPWQRLSVSEAFQQYASMSLEKAIANDRFEEILAVEVEPHLGFPKPAFVFDYPVSLGSLARHKVSDPTKAERFELYIGGIELCNAFSELIDPVEQRKRFEAELDLRKKTGKTIYPIPEKFLDALTNMPTAAGNAMGVDRLIMVLTDAATIDDVVTFTPEEL